MKATANMNCSICAKRETCWGERLHYPTACVCRVYVFSPSLGVYYKTEDKGDKDNAKPSQNGNEQVDAVEAMLSL